VIIWFLDEKNHQIILEMENNFFIRKKEKNLDFNLNNYYIFSLKFEE